MAKLTKNGSSAIFERDNVDNQFTGLGLKARFSGLNVTIESQGLVFYDGLLSLLLNASNVAYTEAELKTFIGSFSVGGGEGGSITDVTATLPLISSGGATPNISLNATTNDIPDSIDKRYVTDANLVVIGNTSGVNTGDNATNTQYSGLQAQITANQTTTVIRTLSDLPTPIANVITLENNVTYQFKGLVNIGTNSIAVGVSNTLMGFDKSDDGIVSSSTSPLLQVTNNTLSVNNITLVSSASPIFSVSNSLSYSVQIRECILSGFSLGTITGSSIFVFNNNIVGNLGDLELTGTFLKIGIATNYWINSTNYTNLVYFNMITADTVKAIDNDFIVNTGKVGIKVSNITITNHGGGYIISNTFVGDGTYIDGIDATTLQWIIENNGRDILSTSDTVTQRKVRSEAELDLYLALPDPTKFSYLLDAEEFIITKPIVVPGGGVNGGLTFFGLGNNFTQLKTVTPNISMFEGGGNLFLNDMIVTCQGANSRVFGMVSSTNFEAVEIININFQDCESLGYLDGFRQGLLINGFMIKAKQGLEFRGTWSGGMRISDSRFRFTPTTGSYMFKCAVGQTFSSRFVTNANSTIGTGSIGYDFTAANFVNDGSFQLIEAQFDGGGTYVNGITASSIKSLWRNCVGVDDTFQGCVYKNTADTITIITSPATYVELSVTNSVIEDVWNSSQSLSAFHSKYDSSLPINERIDIFLALQAGNNNELELEIRKYNSTNTTFTVVDNFKMTSNGGSLGTRVEPVSLASFIRREQNERIRVFIRNNSGTANILTETSSKLIISKR